jgi:hypothetical protein
MRSLNPTVLSLSLFLGSCVATGAYAPREIADMSAVGAENGFVAGDALAPQANAPSESGPDAGSQEAPQVARQVIYSAGLRLVVVSTAAAQASVKEIAVACGGWMSESDARSITIRVPAAQFDAALERIALLGEVADRNVRAQDVTEQMLELDIRLENAKRMRERLLAHLEKSTKVEDTLRIEAELGRVTLEIESIEGKLRLLRSQVAMSTIRVDFNRPQPATRDDGGNLPFQWVSRLGDGLVAGSVESRPRQPRIFSSGPRFTPPPQFVRYYSSDDLVEALSADGVRIKLQRVDNFDKGALEFWSKLARTSLVQTRSLAVTDERALGGDRALVRGKREVAGVANGYLLVLARTKDDVYTFEAWGPEASFAPLAEALEKSALSLKP